LTLASLIAPAKTVRAGRTLTTSAAAQTVSFKLAAKQKLKLTVVDAHGATVARSVSVTVI
jgi:membrane carboxypeptidase/penicillin-binding protein PbpC